MLDQIRHRIPSRNDVILLFLICVFPTHIWSFFALFRKLPSYLIRLSAWDIISRVGYIQLFVLMESLLLASVILFISILLPTSLIRSHFATQTSVLVLLLSIWLAIYHYQNRILQWLHVGIFGYYVLILGWALSFSISLLYLSMLIRRKPNFSSLVLNFVGRIAVLSTVYLLIDGLAVIIVIVRNIALII